MTHAANNSITPCAAHQFFAKIPGRLKQSEASAFADAKVCTPNNGRCKDTDEEESIVKAVCLSSLIAEEKYDVEGIVYLTNSSSVSVDDETVVVDEPDRNEQIV